MENQAQQAYFVLNILMTLIGSWASLVIIYLIHLMGNTSGHGHVFLVLVMSCFQLIYDITLFFSNVYCGYYITVVANFFQVSCGIGGSLVSNWIAFLAWHVITYRTKFDVSRNMWLILLTSLLPGLVDGILYLVAMVPQSSTDSHLEDVSVLGFYYYTRLVTIGFNFVFCGEIIRRFHLMTAQRSTQLTGHEQAIRRVTRSMMYYPIVQAIGRSGNAWYEAQYGASVDPDTTDPAEYACVLFLTVVTPLTSVGYLAIFLVMQPLAAEHLKAILGCCFSSAAEASAETATDHTRLASADSRRSDATGLNSFSTEDAYDMFTDSFNGRLDGLSVHQQQRPRGSKGETGLDWARPSSLFSSFHPSKSGPITEASTPGPGSTSKSTSSPLDVEISL